MPAAAARYRRSRPERDEEWGHGAAMPSRGGGMARFGNGLARADALPTPDLMAAAERAARDALAPLEGRRPDLACIFVCGHDAEQIAEAGAWAAQITAANATIG